MDLRRLLLVIGAVSSLTSLVCGNVVFKVHNKFKGREDWSLTAMRAHDVRCHGRLLSAVDLQLGGNGHPSETGLYFAKIGIGTPSKDYYVQVDTGSDILWVNCIGCHNCPKKSDLGIELSLYDPKSSSTGNLVKCNEGFCTSTYNGLLPGCKPHLLCQYNVVYGDGSSTTGYFVKDNVQLDQVTGNLQTSSINGSVTFGCLAVYMWHLFYCEACLAILAWLSLFMDFSFPFNRCGDKQSGELGSSSEALDGILGFGQANSSMLSQLASSGKVKKIFAHCLDSVNGGGIFAIGDVMQPKVNTTPLVPDQPHYNVIMKEVEVGGDVLPLPTDVFDSGDGKGTIIDSGTTLTYLPDEAYKQLMNAIMAKQPGLKLHTVEEQFSCFQLVGSVDDGFPVVKFHFAASLTLTVYPHDYLFQIREDAWCFGWMNSGIQSKD